MEYFFDVPLVFEILGVLLYVYTVYIITTSRNPTFRNAFYDLFNIAAVFDITLLIAIIYMRTRKRIGLCESWEKYTRIANALTATNFIVNLYINMIIAVNRFTAVMVPLKHNQLWNGKFYISLCVLIVVMSFGSQGYLFLQPIGFKTNGDSCILVKTPDVVIFGNFTIIPKNFPFPRLFSVISVAIFEGDCLILSPLTIYRMLKMKKKLVHQGVGVKQEAGLAFFSLIKCVCFLFELLYELVNLLQVDVTQNWFFVFINSQFWSYFYLLVFMNCAILLVLSSSLRRDIENRWRRTLHSGNTSSATTVL